MRNRILSYIRAHIFPLLLVGIALLIFATNYIPGTFLIGWDNLYPELNVKAPLITNVFPAWQEYRGLGLQDSMAHGANIVHTLFVFFASFVLPTSVIRYFFHVFALLIGALGMYALLRTQMRKESSFAFGGALFYMLNIGTIQLFFAPFEVFSVHFAALPWLVVTVLQYIHTPSKKNLFLLFMAHIGAAPQGFVPTVFIAYLCAVCSVLLVALVQLGWKIWGRIVVLIITIGIASAFWLLPFLHGASVQGEVIQNTKINQHSTDIIYERNKARGTIYDILFLKGFMLDTFETNLEGRVTYMMSAWKEHINQPLLVVLGAVYIGFVCIGLYTSTLLAIRKRTISPEMYFLPLFVGSFFMLGTHVVFLSSFNTFLREVVPFFGEVFRFPFTKFFVIYIFAYSVFMVKGATVAASWVQKKWKKYNFVKQHLILPAAASIGILVLSFPVFRGHLFYEALRLEVPPEYFAVIEYFRNEPADRRVMTLPQTTFWNWMQYDWGARGSGFTWYAMEQAMLERPFDPWSSYNEQYFNEIYYTLQYQDPQLLQNVIQKYDISYIMLDSNIRHRNKNQDKEDLVSLIEEGLVYEDKQQFGDITVYKLPVQPYVTIKDTLTAVGSSFTYEFVDSMYATHGDYTYSADWSYSYMFPALFTNKSQREKEFDFAINSKEITLSPRNRIQGDPRKSYSLVIPPYPEEKLAVPAKIDYIGSFLTVSPADIRVQVEGREEQVAMFEPLAFEVGQEEASASAFFVNNWEIEEFPYYAFLYTSVENSIRVAFEGSGEEESLGSTSFVPELRQEPIEVPLSGDLRTLDLSVTIPLMQPPHWQTDNLLKQRQYEIKSPCDGSFRDGRAYYEEKDGGGVSFLTQDNTNCFSQFLTSVSQDEGVFLYYNVTSDDHPFTVLVDNPQQQSVFIETLLDGEFPQQVVIVPPTSRYQYYEYGTHLRVESSGQNTLYSDIHEMRVGYVPYTWLKSLVIEKQPQPQQKKPAGETFVEFYHPYPFLYIVDLRDILQSTTNPVLYLGQGYNEHWQAYVVNRSSDDYSLSAQLNSLFPFWNGIPIQYHMRVNNWANGWELSNEDSGSLLDNIEHKTIVLVFWPQYLGFVGYGLLLLWGLYIITLYRRPQDSVDTI